MAAPRVSLQSITGVDVELRIAGPGSRTYAFVVDWHIRLIVALAYAIVAFFLYAGQLTIFFYPTDGSWSRFWWIVGMPAAAIYFLYHPVLEIAMRGSTPGKRMAGVRIVTRTGDVPGAGALLLRNVFRIIDAMPTMYLVGLISVVFTSQHVRIGDLAAGTLLILERDDSEHSFARMAPTSSTLDPQAADLVHELLERWDALDGKARGTLGRTLISRIDSSIAADDVARMSEADVRTHLKKLLNPAAA